MMAAATTQRKSLWAVANTVAVIYALLPVLWIASLSLKEPGTLGDGNFVPREWTFENYSGIFATSACPMDDGFARRSRALAYSRLK